eukprot:GHVS01012188.1.p1 GENE.GHVS01012188.1~~GHVS01012188.1.p1  ORF type:complete len:595 (-),score=81.27 GHVS01012188.1:245-1954(-)
MLVTMLSNTRPLSSSCLVSSSLCSCLFSPLVRSSSHNPRRPRRLHSLATSSLSPTSSCSFPLLSYPGCPSALYSQVFPLFFPHLHLPASPSHFPSVSSNSLEASSTVVLTKPFIPSLLELSSAGEGVSTDRAGLPGSPAHRLDSVTESSPLPSFSLPLAEHLSKEPCRRLQFDDLFFISDIQKTVGLLHAEIPKRYAQRVRQVDALDVVWPGCVQNVAELKEVRAIYLSCMLDVWALDPLARSVELNCVIRSLRRRHNRVVALLITALRKVRSHLQHTSGSTNSTAGLTNSIGRSSSDEIERWLDGFLYDFFLNRVSTELLREQYVAALDSGHPSGIVRSQCNVLQVLERSAQQAYQLCTHYMQESPQVIISTQEEAANEEAATGDPRPVVVRAGKLASLSFCCVPCYLHSAAVELLKNALRATVEHYRLTARPGTPLPAVKVIAKTKAGNLWIEVSDKGGGIPTAEQPKVWSFTYTTAPFAYARPDAFANNATGQPPPLAGCGVGLPLSRLYIQYLGGDVWLQSVHGTGTSAFIQLRPLTESWKEGTRQRVEFTSLAGSEAQGSGLCV